MKRTVVLALVAAAGAAAHHWASSIFAAKRVSAKLNLQQDWPVYGGHPTQDHYSELDQINRKNVGKLRVAWTFDTGEPGAWMETNPLVVGHVLYAYTPSQKVIALDAATGKLLWKFDAGVNGGQPARGLAIWTDGQQTRLFAGIMNFLYALDPATGRPLPDFGEGGRLDLRKGLGGDFRDQSVVLTSPGVIYRDLIIVGGRNPETPPAPPGDVRAFDVHTGELRWRFRTIPHPGEAGYSTWPKDAWKTAGAANCWAGMSLDQQRGMVFVPTGSAVPDFYGGKRIGDTLYADSILALDAATGKLVWHFQGVHHDIWDRDFPSAPLLMTLRHEGKSVDVVAQTTKQGFLFVLNRATGKPVFPVEERPVPASTVPGEKSSPTQPFPVLPRPYAMQAVTEDGVTTRTPEAHAWALAQLRRMRSDGQFVPLSVGMQTIVAPGFDGGAEWGGPGADLKTGVIYINTNNIANTGGLERNNPLAGLGAETYQSQCALCHGPNRTGSPPDIPSLVKVEDRLTPVQIANIVHQGKGRMPSFPGLQGDPLTAMLEYLRTGKDTSSATAGKELGHQTLTKVSHPREQKNSAGGLIYAAHCAICHGENEEGVPSFPSLLGVGQRRTAAQIVRLIRVGQGRMPAFPEKSLLPTDLRALLHFLDASEDLTVESSRDVAVPYTFTGYKKFYDQDGYPATKAPWGTLNAIDLNTGQYLWTIPFGEYPDLAAKGLPTTGSENYGGPVVTGGGLVFIGATVFDHKIRAFHSRTGELLWQDVLPEAGLATPSTYMVDGRQYVVIAAGGGKDPKIPSRGFYVSYRLP